MKREDLEKGIANHLRDKTYPYCSTPRCDKFEDCAACEANSLIHYLHSKGLVIRVNKELPAVWLWNECDKKAIKMINEEMLKSGYTAVEPLIKEE